MLVHTVHRIGEQLGRTSSPFDQQQTLMHPFFEIQEMELMNLSSSNSQHLPEHLLESESGRLLFKELGTRRMPKSQSHSIQT
jgi:hypothetical protein